MLRLVAVLVLLFASASRAQHVVAVGGGTRTPEILAEVVRLAGGDRARLVVIPLASGSPDEVGGSQAAEFRAAGAGRVSVLLDVSDTEALRDATAVWFSGGDQNRLVAALRGTEALVLIGDVLNRGGVVAGTSAGAAVMSRTMITGDMRASDGVQEPGYTPTDEGFGFVDDVLGVAVVIDQHFANRQRHARLLSAVLNGPARLGFGVDEATALVASPGGIRVVGRANVTVIDARDAPISFSGGVFSTSGIRLSLLGTYARFAVGADEVP